MASLKARIQAHLLAAQAYANLSSATRLKVGALLIKEDRIISVGYNGMPKGMTNICEYEENGVMFTKAEVCHAEMNAIAFAAKNGISTKNCTMVITHSPCFNCAKLIIQSGIINIYYNEPFRDDLGIDFLKQTGINVSQINSLH